MNNTVYQPPTSEIKTQFVRSGSILKGVLIGLLVDFGGSTLLGMLFGIGYYLMLTSHGASDEQFSEELINFDTLSFFGVSIILIGMLVSLFAGFLSAKYSGGKAFIAAGIVSAASFIFGIFVIEESGAIIEDVLLSVLNVVSVLGGARLWVVRNRDKPEN